MSESPPERPSTSDVRLTVPPQLMVRQVKPKTKAPLYFALVSVVVALLAGGAYIFRQTTGAPARTPEETVNEFLSAVFLAGDPARVSDVVCKSWDPGDAVTRTVKEIPADAHVSWDELAVVSKSETKTTLRARLGLRLRDDSKPSSFEQWRFNLVQENGWHVCEARPFNV